MTLLIPGREIVTNRGHNGYPEAADDYAARYSQDTDRIVAVMAAAGYEISRRDAAAAYAEWCEEAYCASWLGLPLDDAYLFGIIIDECEIAC